MRHLATHRAIRSAAPQRRRRRASRSHRHLHLASEDAALQASALERVAIDEGIVRHPHEAWTSCRGKEREFASCRRRPIGRPRCWKAVRARKRRKPRSFPVSGKAAIPAPTPRRRRQVEHLNGACIVDDRPPGSMPPGRSAFGLRRGCVRSDRPGRLRVEHGRLAHNHLRQHASCRWPQRHAWWPWPDPHQAVGSPALGRSRTNPVPMSAIHLPKLIGFRPRSASTK